MVARAVQGRRGGFTIIEVLVAMMVLMIGLISYVGTSLLTTRMLARANRSSTAAFYVQDRLEHLQSTHCDDLANGTATRGRYEVTWTITDYTAGRAKRARVIVEYPGQTGPRADTTEATISCLR